jgi:hypothetical protein
MFKIELITYWMSRVLQKYHADELKLIHDERNIFNTQMKKLIKVYDNQQTAAQQVFNNFQDTKICTQLVIGQTQSGKTGTMLAIVNEYINKSDIHVSNIFIFTGLSDITWKLQTKSRFPEIIHVNILHRANWKTLANALCDASNVLIIIDEVHIAAKLNQTLTQLFTAANITPTSQCTRDIKIVEFSATPDGVLCTLNAHCVNSSKKVFVVPGAGYTSAEHLLKTGKILQYQPLFDDISAPIDELMTVINKFSKPMYHFIRTPGGISDSKIKSKFKHFYELLFYNQLTSNFDINDVLSKKPTTHTLIFIKEMFRCAKTLCKKYIGVCYERYSNSPNDSTVAQGLIGRLTGYDYNGISICFTNIHSVEKYILQHSTEFTEDPGWSSRTTRVRSGKTTSANTFHTDETKIVKKCGVPTSYKIFHTQDEAKLWYVELCLVAGLKMGKLVTKKSTDNWYLEEKKILSMDACLEMGHNVLNRVGGKRHTRYLAYYDDVNDSKSIMFMIVFITTSLEGAQLDGIEMNVRPAKRATKKVAKPTTKKVVKPTTKKVVKPTTKKVAKPTTEKVVKPTTEKVAILPKKKTTVKESI